MSYLINCSDTYNNNYEPKYRTFPFELDHFQKYACEGIDLNHNVFVAVATGSGKTVPAEYAIAKALAEEKKVVYISPIKALSNQKYKDFSETITDIGIMTGDNKVNPQASLVIMTAEIFRNSLYRSYWNQETDIDAYSFQPDLVKYVILDEVHYINDRDRGKVWEEILMLLPTDVHLTMLSATIDSPEILANWVGNHQKKETRLIKQYKRPVPLKFYLQNMNEKTLIMDETWRKNSWKDFKCKKYQPIHWINHCITQLEKENKLPSIFFTLSKSQIDTFVHKINGNFLDKDEINRVNKIWDDNLLKYKKDFETSTQFLELYNLVIRGVGYHHSGIIPILKEIVELLYSEKLIKVLLATETFAVGVNMPTKTVVFTGLSKHDNNGRRLLRTDEFLQMAGRAGRRGLDTFGEVIILPNYLPSEDEFKSIILGKPLTLQSRLKLDYTWILRNLYNIKTDNITIENLEEYVLENLINFAKKSFLEKNSDIHIEREKEEIFNITEKIQILEKCIPDYLYDEYISVLNDLEKKQNKKKKKLNLQRLNKIKENKLYNKISQLKNLHDEFENRNMIFEKQKDKIKDHLYLILNYLQKQGFIKNYILTSFGLISKEINEINPLVFSRLAFDKDLDNITFSQLTGLLSIFIETKQNKDDNKYLSDLEISDYEYNLLEKSNSLSNYYLDNEIELAQKLPYPLYQDYGLTLNHYEIVKQWSEGKPWKELKHKYNNFEGNFCKLILRIHNLLREVKMIFEILGNNRIVEMINENEDILIREIVQTESLYLN